MPPLWEGAEMYERGMKEVCRGPGLWERVKRRRRRDAGREKGKSKDRAKAASQKDGRWSFAASSNQ